MTRPGNDPERGSCNRRTLLRLGGAALGAALLPRPLAAAPAAQVAPLERAMAESDLVYLTPLRSDGRESSCQAEVWFVADGADVVAVTASDAWRARAVRSGLTRTRLWVGDVGVWTRSDGAYRQLPSVEAEASLVTASDEHARLLERFGDKYPLGWIVWGPRFRNGLQDGSRVMLRYRPVGVS